VRSALAEVDPDVPAHSFRTLEAAVDSWSAASRSASALLATFAALAALLAAIGIYGVLAYSVAQREHEIGVRMALGADRTDVLGLVVRDGMRPVVAGLLLGTVGALGLTRWIESLLFEVHATDPATYVSIGALFGAVAVLACLVPAWRATKTDPIVAIRAG